MKKLITFLLTITFISNSFGMLNQKSLIRKIATHKKINSFHTSRSTHASDKASTNHNLLKENNALLHKIIEQNKENNGLLRTIVKQNYLQSYHNKVIHGSVFTSHQFSKARTKDVEWRDIIPLEELIPLAHDWQLPLIKYMLETDKFIESLKKE
jgi:hypothetical protein